MSQVDSTQIIDTAAAEATVEDLINAKITLVAARLNYVLNQDEEERSVEIVENAVAEAEQALAKAVSAAEESITTVKTVAEALLKKEAEAKEEAEKAAEALAKAQAIYEAAMAKAEEASEKVAQLSAVAEKVLAVALPAEIATAIGETKLEPEEALAKAQAEAAKAEDSTEEHHYAADDYSQAMEMRDEDASIVSAQEFIDISTVVDTQTPLAGIDSTNSTSVQ